MPTSFPFKGKSIDDGLHMILEGDGGGRLRVAKSDTETRGGEVHLKEGAAVEVLEAPTNFDVTLQRTDPACGGGHTACIGAIEICCGSGKVIHACMGVWGCP